MAKNRQSAAAAGNATELKGTIANGDYLPPPGAVVHWARGGTSPERVDKVLSPDADWNGENEPAEPFLARYAEGDKSVVGLSIVPMGNEATGGEADAILTALLGRPATRRQTYDFAIGEGGNHVLGVADYERIVGKTHPTGKVGRDGSKAMPLWVDDPRHEYGWVEQLVDGRWVQNIHGTTHGEKPDIELPAPPAPTPTEKPPATKPALTPPALQTLGELRTWATEGKGIGPNNPRRQAAIFALLDELEKIFSPQ
jgi:hypothetical protein